MRAIVNFLIVFFIALLISSSMQAQQKNDTLILHFAFNRYNLRPEEAGRLRQFLHDHSLKTDSLYIIGFTDTVGTEAYNMRLSYKGMGNAKARNANPVTNDEARANMRVEVRVFRKPLQ